MKRLFIATQITLNESYLNLIACLKSGCRHDDIVWVNHDLQHLTLRFLGATPENQIPALKEMLGKIVADTQSFSLEMNKLGVFGSRYAPSVIWLGFNEFEPFSNLFNTVESELCKLGFQPNYGNFVPHITAGRVKKVDSKKRFWELIEKSQPESSQLLDIKEISLIQSHLTTQGPVYKVLDSYMLKQ